MSAPLEKANDPDASVDEMTDARSAQKLKVERTTSERHDAAVAPAAGIYDMTDAQSGQMLGPSWAKMTPRQRALYPDGLSQREKDLLWGYEPEEDDHV